MYGNCIRRCVKTFRTNLLNMCARSLRSTWTLTNHLFTLLTIFISFSRSCTQSLVCDVPILPFAAIWWNVSNRNKRHTLWEARQRNHNQIKVRNCVVALQMLWHTNLPSISTRFKQANKRWSMYCTTVLCWDSKACLCAATIIRKHLLSFSRGLYNKPSLAFLFYSFSLSSIYFFVLFSVHLLCIFEVEDWGY